MPRGEEPVKPLDLAARVSDFPPPMSRSPLLRRLLSLCAVLGVVFAPQVQLAHAESMAHSAECATAAGGHDHQGSQSHGHHAQHQHDAACCDFCGTGCATVALPALGISAPVQIARIVAVAPPSLPRSTALSAQHLLPFSLAPPSTSV